MTSNRPLSIAFSQEELLVIMNYLKFEKIPGLEVELFSGLDGQQLKLLLGVAERALIARGFLKILDEKRFDLISEVKALVGACALPDKSILVSRQEKDRLDSRYYFHVVRKMNVLHTVVLSGIHQFMAVEEVKDLEKVVFSILKPITQKFEVSEKFVITDSEFEQLKAITETNNNANDLRSTLSVRKIDEKLVTLLIESFRNPISNTTFVVDKKIDSSLSNYGFTLVQGNFSWWLLEPERSTSVSNGNYSVRMLDEAGIVDKIKNCFLD